MKIAMLCRYPSSEDWGGVATHIRCLVKYLAEYKHRKLFVHVLSFGEKDDTVDLGNAELVFMKSHWYYYVFPFLALLRLTREVQKIKPSIIHVQGMSISPYSLYAIFSRRNCRKLVTAHNLSSMEKVAQGYLKQNSLRTRILRQLEKLIIKQSDHIIVSVSELKNHLVNELNTESEKITVVHNGVDTNEFNPLLKGEIIRKKYGIEKSDALMIFAKPLVAHNGPQFAVRALPYIVEKFPSARLLIAGDGPLKGELVEIAEQLQVSRNTIFVGVVPHRMMKYYLAASDAVIIPSVSISGHKEGCSILMLEAMAMEKPVIAFPTGGLREIIGRYEIGILVPDRDPRSIASAVIQILKDPRYAKAIGEKARKHVTKEMTCSRNVEKTVEIYEKLNGNTSR